MIYTLHVAKGSRHQTIMDMLGPRRLSCGLRHSNTIIKEKNKALTTSLHDHYYYFYSKPTRTLEAEQPTDEAHNTRDTPYEVKFPFPLWNLVYILFPERPTEPSCNLFLSLTPSRLMRRQFLAVQISSRCKCASAWLPHTMQRTAYATTTGPQNGSGTGETSSTEKSSTVGTTGAPRVKKIMMFDENEGLSPGLGGFGHYAGSISAFMDPEKEKARQAPLPCDQSVSEAGAPLSGDPGPSAINSQQLTERLHAEQMTDVVQQGGSLPQQAGQNQQIAAPRRPPAFLDVGPSLGSSLPPLPSPARPSSLPNRQRQEQAQAKAKAKAKAAPAPSEPATSNRSREAEDYYSSLPKNAMSKEEMWSRIQAANADKNERLGLRKPTESGGGARGPLEGSQAGALDPHEVDFAKMEEELKAHDPWHYQLGTYAFKAGAEESELVVAKQRCYDYFTLWTLAMALNKARWNMLEVNAQRGVKTTGAGMKILFWKEAVRGILQSGDTSGASFTESHPVLRPFASVVRRHPKLTKSFVRGFTDARLRTLQQPANTQQLFDHFDKFYGYFYNSLLEVTELQDEAAEHALLHIGRANGITNHCVMFWKKYAALGVTLLPADLCADHCVHLGLLKRISLASRDRAVRRLLCDVMGVAKTEMLHAEKLAKDIHPKTWPILMECFYPNYYLNFLQKRDFNVSAMFADYNIENMGFTWFRIKKRLEWQREQSIEKLLSDAAPVPIINRCVFYRGTAYKMATPARGSAGSQDLIFPLLMLNYGSSVTHSLTTIIIRDPPPDAPNIEEFKLLLLLLFFFLLSPPPSFPLNTNLVCYTDTTDPRNISFGSCLGPLAFHRECCGAGFKVPTNTFIFLLIAVDSEAGQELSIHSCQTLFHPSTTDQVHLCQCCSSQF
eukprot:gene8191-5717_t